MNSGTNARENSGTEARVYLNEDHFDRITRWLGATSDAARARLLNVDPKTIYRARRGVIGGDFIARAVHTLHKHSNELESIGIEPNFEAVFEVREGREAA